MTIDDFHQQWVNNDPRFANAERLDGKQHRGSAHIQPPDQLSTENFMAIGDTVPSVDPLWGQGIDNCIQSGRAAAVTADHCLMGVTDTSADEMSIYDDLWHRDVAPQATVRLLMAHLLYYAPNDRYDRFMQDLRRLGTETLAAANSGNPLALTKLLHREDLSLLRKFARDNGDVIAQALPRGFSPF
jgi:digeranylgeranylglycerophospholipid reductase